MSKKMVTILLLLVCIFIAPPGSYADESNSQYVVGVDDVLEIKVQGHSTLDTTTPVTSDGSISFPYIGSITIKGMSLSEVEREISKRLADGYIKYPVVSVKMSTSKSLKFFVCGEVKNPGRYVLEDNMTVLKAISAAGGITLDGLYGSVKLRRMQKEKQDYSEIAILLKNGEKGSAGGDTPLQAEDIVIVGRNKDFFVYGEVLKPGKYTLEDNMTVLKAISLAGGFAKYGSPDRVKVLRTVPGKVDYESIKVDVKGAVSGQIGKDIRLLPNDIVVASEGVM
ncbi:MAG: SLBB domain-containing protein [Planctomycetes bacterium]|nr:SLBB domain-containing protein [Planctomycetota bacterium]